ncbi:MAG: hypothetical protein R3F11_22670 [Verrucomicrobiales bacterium]
MKIVFILATILMLASIVLGIQNRQTFIDTRKEKDQTDANIKSRINDANELETEIQAIHKETNGHESRLNEAIATLESEQSKMKVLNQELTNLKAQEAQVDMDIEMRKKEFEEIKTLLGITGDEIDVDAIKQELDTLKRTVADKEREEMTLDSNVSTAEKKLADNNGIIARLEQVERERSAGVARNAMEATITAVNRDWGFVVLNAGKAKGISTESKLIVKRGESIIGSLNIVSIEDSLTVADIDESSMPEGARMMPGDKVILENLTR